MTTTGYGDVAPLHPVARSLCPMEGDAAGTSGHARDRALQSGLNAIRESFRRCSHQDATKLPDLYNATLC
ncbi:potassium channel family protein [Bradyrhizobium sp. WYCCWR 13023]|uniref:Potassium channel family protein n=1 Tax=Bradyrhizobium zhengyangense TaxID=2911009 RepID=A0A9X1R327_9BRAD|nr:potassium channel family protein [Bradyrhizobium zhengyangense]MCG2625369.1 potassium channel family protein [Bradyrhizobium zhengyangense]MCG2641806.1 potassium channel family protein [Bradyrhizobium zhengyangense]MCG2667439.1 potassium channel family protein [Bradyrhizobium zhengyangense]